MGEAARNPLIGFGLGNYRSFDQDGFLLDGFRKINILIGKNNVGKSNILSGIRLLKRVKSARMQQGADGLLLDPKIDAHLRQRRPGPSSPGPLIVSAKLSVDALLPAGWCANVGPDILFRWNTENGDCVTTPKLSDTLRDDHLEPLFNALTQRHHSGRAQRAQVLGAVLDALLNRAVSSLRLFDTLVSVPNFREARAGGAPTAGQDIFNGHDIISRLREMQHPLVGDDSRRVFDRLGAFVGQLLGQGTLALEIPNSEHAIYVNMQDRRLPLASLGTGVHQLVILCAALAIHHGHTVCIEEPEIHMHPELQRQFLRFISTQTDHRYFITTHSNVFLDALPDVAIYYVSHDGTKSTVARVDASERARDVLTDLGYKASDLLQANCLIWVEGPSDRVYLNKWLSLVAPELVEGIHYAVTFQGGNCLSHLSAVDEPEQDLIEALRINRHAVFIMDRDQPKADGTLRPAKDRLLKELALDAEQCWVTQGREIENYLPAARIEAFLSDHFAQPIALKFGRGTKLDTAITAATRTLPGRRVAYERAKVAYARAFSEKLDASDLDVLDLRQRLTAIVKLIRGWNHMDQTDLVTSLSNTASG